ncbi:scyllo-inositol 2-dehydrogenase (NAD(+)) [Spirochaetota bacterium]|nr:scyllo-inositol 2-dehydrogenase (NAD(+)) [Spirochaetota bacterium]
MSHISSKVNVAIVGLGRLGKRHAENLAFRTRHVNLKAACSVVEDELAYARTELGIPATYTDYRSLLEKEKDLDVVFLVSSSNLHSEQIMLALEHDLHVFCEKPLSLTVEEGLAVHEVHKKHPTKIVALGFMKRCDPSHDYVKKIIDSGELGQPFLVRSQTVDKYTMARFQLQFAKTGGSIFMDYNVHDIDIARWFLGSNVKEVYALGGAYDIKEFAEFGEADNTSALCRFVNGTMANVSASRIAPHGAAMFTEVLGTKKWLSIGFVPALNKVQVADEHGARYECVEDFYGRFEEAFLLQTQDVINCIREGRKPRASILDGLYASQVAIALKESFDDKKLVQLPELELS